LAANLGLPPGTISEQMFPLLGWFGVANLQPIFCTPETDAAGRVVGYIERYGKGCGREVQGKYLEKIAATGCGRGLTIFTGWRDRSGPFFCVEAFSDTAAMTAAGLCCVGRPNNDMGAEFLAELLKDWPADREIVICGEHDIKPDGDWPGDRGARTVARELVCRLNRPITIAFPPNGAKDVRVWLTSPDRGEQPWAERGRELLAKMMASVEIFDPTTCQNADQSANGPREKTQDEKDREKGAPPSPLAMLVGYAKSWYELFRSQLGDAFACRLAGTPKRPGVLAYSVEEQDFKDQLYALHARFVDDVEIPSTSTIKNAYTKLAADARQGEQKLVYLRSGRHSDPASGEAVYVYGHDVDCFPTRTLRIDRDGWQQVLEDVPVRFQSRRSAGVLPLPETGGCIDDLRPLMNLEDESQLPVIGAWVAAAVAGVPTPILMLAGRQDSAKSTFARMLIRLVDPNGGPMRKALLLRPPKDDEAIMVSAKNNSIMCYDNLSSIDPELADALCLVATGGYYSARKKWTNGDQFLVDLQRPLVLTGIDLPSLRGDLLSRMLTVHLKPISDASRLTDEEVDARFDAARPRILAWVYDLVSRGLDDRIDISGLQATRMGWFSQFAARAIGVKAVEAIMAANVADNDESNLEGCVFRDQLLKVVADSGNFWRGTMKELLEDINDEYGQTRDKPDGWPKNPIQLSTKLTRHAPALERGDGLRIEKGDGQRTKKNRVVVITKMSEKESPDPPNYSDVTGSNKPRDKRADPSPTSSPTSSPASSPTSSPPSGGLDWDLEL